MQEAEDLKVEQTAPVSHPDGRPDLSASAPAPDAGQQPGFKVVDETPPTANNKLIWTALIVVIAVLAAYALGAFR